MSHAHHFLQRLDRVTREQTELALSLYRDHEAVAYVLGHIHVPEAAPRVALAVDAAPDGPVVVVTREGRFVTCLAAGMRHDLPRVPHGQLLALLAKARDRRARRELVRRELRPDEEEGDLLQRIFTRGSRMAREDFVALTAFEPLLGFGPYLSMVDVAAETLKTRTAMQANALHAVVNGSTVKALEKIHRMEWSVAHLTMLAGAAERPELDKFLTLGSTPMASPTFPCSVHGGATFYLRSAWMAARCGKAVLPQYKVTFAGGGDWTTILDAGMGLVAIALRHGSAMAEVRRALGGYGPPVAAPARPDESRVNIAHSLTDLLDHAEERMATTIRMGKDFAVTMSAHLPEGHPRRFDTPEAVPDDVAITSVLSFDADMFDPRVQGMAITALATAARASAEDFYHPRDLVRAWRGAWLPEETLERVRRFARAEQKPKPVRAERTPGRNDPCSCGSGRKWKKCHGGSPA